MSSLSQKTLDVMVFLLLSLFVFLYFHGLDFYLVGLSNPLPMKFILGTTLFVGFLYDLHSGLSRKAGISVLATAIVFAAATILAGEYRGIYLSFLVDLKSAREATNIIGEEYVLAINNPAVGIGSCFALALASIRLPLRAIMHKLLSTLFIVEGNLKDCPCCGRPVI